MVVRTLCGRSGAGGYKALMNEHAAVGEKGIGGYRTVSAAICGREGGGGKW